MSLLSDIKKGVANSGSSKGKIVYLKPDSKNRYRFLQDIEDGMKVIIHDSFAEGITALCGEYTGVECPYCETEGMRHREAYIWSVWDVEGKEVKLFVGYANNFNPLPNLIAMYETYGTVTDRDYVLQRDGSGTNSKYSAIPMDKVRFKNTKAKPYTEAKALDILAKAFPIDDVEEEEDKPAKKKPNKKAAPKGKRKPDPEPEEDEDEDNEYEEMTPKELYMECVERGLAAKKKQKAAYYIDLLEEDDEAKGNDDEDEWDDEEEDEDGDDW